MHLEYKSTIGENGRIILPVKIRNNLHLLPGDQIIFVLDKEELKMVPLKSTIKRFQEIIKKHNKNNISMVDSLIAERRQESENEGN